MLLMSNLTPRIERVDDRSAPSYGKFVVEPLERGYGTTLGSALRRVLLSSIPGAALKSVRIEGVLHEFSTIPGVVEDTTDVMLNLKEVAFKIIPGSEDRPAEEPREVRLYRTGPGEVAAADIELPPDVEIANPGHHLATLSTEDARLDIRIEVQMGTGFVSAEQQDRSRMAIGTIPVDSIYSPVRHVAYRVDPTRVGSATDLDRLTLEVRTNGTVSPQEVISDAAKILDRYLILFFDFGEQEEQGLYGERLGQIVPGGDVEIKALDFSVRTFNCLRKVGISIVGELLQHSESELMAIKNFGRKSLNEVKDKLTEMGLSLRDSGEGVHEFGAEK